MVINLLISISLFAVLLFSTSFGRQNRWYVAKPVFEVVGQSQMAFFSWRDHGVKGRVLFLFDRSIANAQRDTDLSRDNFVFMGIRHNLVRTVYQVVPDNLWAEVDLALRNNVYAVPEGRGYRIPVQGVPVHVLRLGDIRPVGEKVLVHISGEYWNAAELGRIVDLLRQRVLVSDVVTVSGELPETAMQAIKEQNENR